jgi:hypothetical protein
MKFRHRIQYHALRRFQRPETQRRWDAQYMQWVSEGYSRLVQIEMIVLALVFLVLYVFLPTSVYASITPYIYQIARIRPELYKRYKRRYLDLWNPIYPHARILIRFFPNLVPLRNRRSAYNRYVHWQRQISHSPSTSLNKLVTLFEAREVDPNWYRDVKNLLEFVIWPGGQIEKPFHLRQYGTWALQDFPDPKFQDPIRYALAASIIEQMVDVFNWRSQLGIRRDYIQTGYETMRGKRWDLDYPPPRLERPPEWAARVPPSPVRLVVRSYFQEDGLSYDRILCMYDEDDKLNPHFLKRGFIADADILQFV